MDDIVEIKDGVAILYNRKFRYATEAEIRRFAEYWKRCYLKDVK